MSQQCPYCCLAVHDGDTFCGECGGVLVVRLPGGRAGPAPRSRPSADPSLRLGQGSYCRAAALHAGRSRRGPAHRGSGTKSCASGRHDRRTRPTGISRAAAVRIQGGNRNEVLHGMRRGCPRPAVLHELRRGFESPARPGRGPAPDHHRPRPTRPRPTRSRPVPGGAARSRLGPAGVIRAGPVRIRSAPGLAVPPRAARSATAFA